MIENLYLKNFKSARDLTVRIAPLTVLSGLNGSGKSSVLQSIALLKQSSEDLGAQRRLHLRGDLVQLGRCEDVLFENAGDDEIIISFKTSLGEYKVVTRAKEGLDTLEIVGGATTTANIFKHFQYIQADRITPATQYGQASATQYEEGWLGCRGEYTVDFLGRKGSMKVSQRRAFSRDALGVGEALYKQVAPTDSLLDQTAGWLQQISPGVRLRTSAIDYADAVSLRYEYTGIGIDSGSRLHRSTNVGFGLTYCLPIVVACLAAPEGALLLLENPEAHLHPQGQAALGELLAHCAADGVQVIVETHSDHVLNGIRLSVKKRVIQPQNVSLQYFVRDVESGESNTQCPQILPDGQLMDWPIGFFDQWDRSLDLLLN
jgi:predicted ATPase